MAGTGPSQSDVATAYDALVDDGIQPSISTIRQHLGNTGSLEMIADHVRALKSERWQEPATTLPDTLLQSLVADAQKHWEANNAQHSAQLDAMRAARDEALKEIDTLRDSLAEHQSHKVTMEAQFSDTVNQQKKIQLQLNETQEQLTQTRTQLNSGKTEILTITQERDEALRLLTELQQSSDEIKTHYEAQLSRGKTEMLAMTKERDEALRLLAESQQSSDEYRVEYETQLSSGKTEMLAMTQERDEALRLLTDSQQSIEVFKSQFQTQNLERKNIELVRDRTAQAMSSRLDEMRDALSDATQSVERLESDKELQEQERDSLSNQITTLQNTLASSKNQITELQNAFKTLRSENTALNAQLNESITVASEAEKRRQALVKSLNADFAVVLGNTRSIEHDSNNKPSLLERKNL